MLWFVALLQELAKALNTDVNSLPLSLDISWFEQKAVAVLLTLLNLGVQNIRLGPNLPGKGWCCSCYRSSGGSCRSWQVACNLGVQRARAHVRTGIVVAVVQCKQLRSHLQQVVASLRFVTFAVAAGGGKPRLCLLTLCSAF